MNIILSFFLSMYTCYIGIEEMKEYDSIDDRLRNVIYLYPLLLLGVFYTKGNTTFSLYFGAITPLLISHFIVDVKEQELPDYNNLAILILGITMLLSAFVISGFDKELLPVLGGFVLSGVILFIVYLIIAILTGGALGGGDIKLVGALGIFFHWGMLIKLLVFPIFLGAIWGIVLLLTKKANKESKFAFGPAIIIAMYLMAIL